MQSVEVYYIPATRMAREMGAPTLANMIITGKLMAACPEISNAFLKKVYISVFLRVIRIYMNLT